MTFPTGNTGNGKEPWWASFISKEGLGVAIAIFLIYWLTMTLGAGVTKLQGDMRDHMSSTTFYSHQFCVLLAKQNGEPPELCEQPKEH